ncbi:hypothetical protein I3760_08G075500 [Carya illinoinensis]|nr:hypothetical protein I3760_08G075500 [Carya illinoinensis]
MKLETLSSTDGVQTSEISAFGIFDQKVRPLGIATPIQLDKKLFKTARWYALNNCTEIERGHYNILKEQSLYNIERMHEAKFSSWFRKRSATIATIPLAGRSTHNVNNQGNINDISDEEEFNSSDTMSNGSCEEEDLDDTDAESNVDSSPSDDTDRGWDSS